MESTDYDFNAPTEEIGIRIAKRVDSYYDFILRSGLLGLFRRSHYQYNAGLFRRGRILKTGDQGQISDVSTNDYRNVLQHVKVMATNVRPSWDVRAGNSNYKSEAEALLAPGLLDYYNRRGGMAKVWDHAAELCLEFGFAAIETLWDPSRGSFYALDDQGNPIMNGDIAYKSYGPVDTIYDITKQTVEDRFRWAILRESRSKYELCALYPDKADQIMMQPSTRDIRREIDDFYLGYRDMAYSDSISVYRLYHEHSPEIPQGRFTVVCGKDLVLEDEPLIYPRIPVTRMVASTIDRTNIGYTVGFDMLATQRVIDILYSTIITNQSTFGIQNITAPKGSDVSPRLLPGNLNFIEYLGPNKPEVLQLLQTSPEIFKMLQLAGNIIEQQGGINSTVRGQPPANLESGAALAMMASQAIQFNNDFQGACTTALEDIGLTTLQVLACRANTDRQIGIVGKIPGQFIEKFKGEQLKAIDSVQVDLGNPIQRTSAGRSEMAQQLAQMNMLKDPGDYFQVLTTGRIEPIMEAKTLENFRIKYENEQLIQCIDEEPLLLENHPRHINEHTGQLASPSVRNNPQAIQCIQNHIMKHLQLWQTAPPDVLMALGIPPLPPPPPPPGMMPPPNGPQGGPPPPSGPAPHHPGKGKPDPVSGIVESPQELASKHLPDNPMTGQKFNYSTGGM